MKNKRTGTTTKALRPNARVETTCDSFQNFAARIGYGAGNVADGG